LIVTISNVVMTGATLFLAIYAYVTIQEGKKNRRKDKIEKMLEQAYSPLYEILRRAKFENGERSAARQKGGFDFAVTPVELDRMREIMERFGHLIGKPQSERISMIVERSKYTRTGTSPWRGFTSEMEMDKHYNYLREERDRLRQELDELTSL